MMADTCGVCEDTPPKYRCASCEVRYCSLVCYKTHQQVHLEGNNPASKTASQLGTTERPTSLSSAPHPAEPLEHETTPETLADLASNPKLSELLHNQPQLRDHLFKIYEATQGPPREEHSRDSRRRGTDRSSDYRWTEKKGEAYAVKMVSRLRSDKQSGMEDFITLLSRETI